jgi:SAM-dependent methyltransferase
MVSDWLRTEHWKNRFYPSGRYLHHDEIFADWVRSALTPASVVLDVGAGTGREWPYDLKHRCRRVVGLDVRPEVVDNPNLHEAVVGDFFANGFADATFDVVLANFVVEHIERPEAFLLEIKRVLKPGGAFFFRTLNKNHYAGLVSRLTPHAFHVFYGRLLGRHERETFPVRYRMNSARALAALGRRLHFRCERRMFEGFPGYLEINPALFLVGVAYERLVNRLPGLEDLKGIMMAKVEFD